MFVLNVSYTIIAVALTECMLLVVRSTHFLIVYNSNIFLAVSDQIVFILISELRGKVCTCNTVH